MILQDLYLQFAEAKTISEYVRITLLDWQENPIVDFAGVISDGSLSKDGESAIRQTMTLSMMTEDPVDIMNILKRQKIKLELGYDFSNTPDSNITWFEQGIFVIQDFSAKKDQEGYIKVDITAGDKMLLLDGTLGGTIPENVNFHQSYTENEDGEIEIEEVIYYTIIRELVNHYGKEDLTNIFIFDVPLEIRETLSYRGDKPLYLEYLDIEGQEGYSGTFLLEPPSIQEQFAYRRIVQGQDIGYRLVPFVPPNGLECEAGDTVLDVLEEIIEVIGNHEFYYDTKGRFIFREKRNYMNKAFSPFYQDKDSQYYALKPNLTEAEVVFFDNSLFTTITNKPKLEDVYNDFIVWGERTSLNDEADPILYHLAVDRMPLHFDHFISKPIWEDKYADTLGDWEKAMTSPEWRHRLYLLGKTAEYGDVAWATNDYKRELDEFWERCYDIETIEWKYDLKTEVSQLPYFLDFLSPEGVFGEFSVDKIGRRTKVVNDTSINCVINEDIPDIFFVDAEDTAEVERLREMFGDRRVCQIATTSAQINLFDLIVPSVRSKTGFDVARELVYKHLNLQQSISIESIILPFLKENMLIALYEPDLDIDGLYWITKIDLPLGIGKNTMNIEAVKAHMRI